MNETMVTVVGNVATEPEFRTTAAGVPVVRFRLATTVRRFDRERGAWADAHTSFYTVRAWRALARNLSSSVALGEPLLVHGRLRVQEGEREGGRWSDTSIDALSAGHDLARGTSAFARTATSPTTAVSARATASTSTGTATVARPNGPAERGVHAGPSPSFRHGSLAEPSAGSAGGDRVGARARASPADAGTPAVPGSRGRPEAPPAADARAVNRAAAGRPSAAGRATDADVASGAVPS